MNKKSRSALMIFTVAGLFLLLASCVSSQGQQSEDQFISQGQQSGSPTPIDNTPQAEDRLTLAGTIRSGTELDEVKQHCPEGLYLVADEGFLVGQTTMLLLRTPSTSAQATMFSDQQYVGKKVEVVGKYPAQEIFCEALICECEDYILLEGVESR